MTAEMYEMIGECFNQDYNCCQAVLSFASDLLGFDKNTALKLAAAFGGGMGHGETCGCVTAGLMALGLAYGNPHCEEDKKRLSEFKAEFESRFRNKNGSLKCRDLLGLDFAKPEEKAQILESGVLKSRCPQLACDAGFILERLLLLQPREMGVGCSCGNH